MLYIKKYGSNCDGRILKTLILFTELRLKYFQNITKTEPTFKNEIFVTSVRHLSCLVVELCEKISRSRCDTLTHTSI